MRTLVYETSEISARNSSSEELIGHTIDIFLVDGIFVGLQTVIAPIYERKTDGLIEIKISNIIAEAYEIGARDWIQAPIF